MSRYDFIIAGGGVAGLSLAYHLVQSPLRERSILIIDRDRKTRNDRTLSFWAAEPGPFDPIAFRTWDRLKVAGEGFETVATLGDYRYCMIRGIDFYQFVRQTLAAYPNVAFVQSTISRIDETDQQAVVRVDEQTAYTGQWVFDSRFPPSAFQAERARCRSFQQHFLGWEIETETAVFDPQMPMFMDFRLPQPNGLCFCYVLPFSERHALVEYVRMGRSQAAHGSPLKTYLENAWGINSYHILTKEGGTSPITDWVFPRRAGRHIMNIGTRGGRVKPSSGYAFTRIQRDSAAIVRSLLTSGHPFDVPPDTRFYRLCDSLMLRVMARRGDGLVPLFIELFKRNSIDRILSFLDERASPGQNLRLTTSLLPALIAQMLASAARPGEKS
jgi:lycopene beta-cyclase